MTTTYLAQETSAGNPILNISIFGIFLVVTMAVVLRAGKSTKKASDFYTGGGSFSGRQNGLAISGDYLSAASFLGIVGAVALNGYDGFLYSVGFFVAWLVALMLVAEPMRNVGRFTMADVLSFRLKQKPVRVAASIATLFVTLFYLIAQMAGAGSLVAVLLNIHDFKWQAVVVGIVGVLMILYVLVGGMKGTTYVQMIKAVLLVTGVVVMCIMVFVSLRGGFSNMFSTAIDMHASSDYLHEKGYEAKEIMEPGLKYGGSTAAKLDFISLGMSLVLGVGGLPHVLMRFYTVPTAVEARRSVTWAIVIIGAFYLMTLILGYGAAALVGPDRILNAPGGANAAAPLLALEIGGSIFMAIISAVAFATVLAVVAGLAITASASIAHDIYHAVIRNGESTEAEQVRVSQATVVILGIVSIILGILAMTQNVAFLYTGVVSCLVLIFFSPAVSGTESAMFPNADWAIFPLTSPGLVSIPLSFFVGWFVSIVTKPDNLDELAAEMEVRSLTGVGVEAPVQH